MDLVIQSPDELIAAIPHVMGFKPEESVVLVPLTQDLPFCRVDLPPTARDRDQVWESLSGPYGRAARPGARLAIVCMTDDRRNAELASQDLSHRFEGAGISTPVRLWADGERWREFNSGAAGFQTPAAAEHIAAATVLRGRAQPAASRDSLGASMIGDRAPLGQSLPAARAAAAASTPSAERDWALDRVEQFHADGNRLTDPEGARMLVALETISTRDAVWEDMNQGNAGSHAALWTDLTRRAPDEVRAAPASMLGFASWLQGNGAKAWCALDQVPAEQSYTMAALVASALQGGLHPREWETHQAQMRDLGEIDESFVPQPPGRQREIPGAQPAADRPAPGR